MLLSSHSDTCVGPAYMTVCVSTCVCACKKSLCYHYYDYSFYFIFIDCTVDCLFARVSLPVFAGFLQSGQSRAPVDSIIC